MNEDISGYKLSRDWFDFCFENPEKISPNHSAVYFFAIEHCNRLGWKKKFGFPSTMAMEAVGIKSYNTYIKTLRDLISFGFIEMIEKSQNQYSSNIIALSKFNKSLDKSLDKALIKHTTKQSETTVQTNDSIYKQINNEPLNNEQGNKGDDKSSIPSLVEVRNYFDENGYDPDVGEKAFNIYNASLEDNPKRRYWRDSRDNLIKNWKMKMRSVWFKPENVKGNSNQNSFSNGNHKTRTKGDDHVAFLTRNER